MFGLQYQVSILLLSPAFTEMWFLFEHIQPHHSEEAEVLHLKGPLWPSGQAGYCRLRAPTLGLQIAVNSQTRDDAGTS